MYVPPLNKSSVTVRAQNTYDVKTIGDLFHMVGCHVFEVKDGNSNFEVKGRIPNDNVDTLRKNINIINDQANTLIAEII